MFSLLLTFYFKDKMSKTYKPGSIEWISFGEIQTYIKDNIRKKPRDSLVPTFSEFAQFVAVDAAVLTSKVNNHWKPIYFNCAPCIEK